MNDWEEKNMISRVSADQQIESMPPRIGQFLGDPEQIAARIADTAGMTFAREDRFKCRDCRDSGYVTIWSPQVVYDVIRHNGEIDWDRARTCVVLCTCDAADQNAQDYSVRLGNGGHPKAGKPLPVFGDRWWHVASNGVDAKAKAATLQLPNHNSEFDSFGG